MKPFGMPDLCESSTSILSTTRGKQKTFLRITSLSFIKILSKDTQESLQEIKKNIAQEAVGVT